jgi:hypothetical protein
VKGGEERRAKGPSPCRKRLKKVAPAGMDPDGGELADAMEAVAATPRQRAQQQGWGSGTAKERLLGDQGQQEKRMQAKMGCYTERYLGPRFLLEVVDHQPCPPRAPTTRGNMPFFGNTWTCPLLFFKCRALHVFCPERQG